jgi:hypothetical protein
MPRHHHEYTENVPSHHEAPATEKVRQFR